MTNIITISRNLEELARENEAVKSTNATNRTRRSLNRARFMGTLDLRLARTYLQLQTDFIPGHTLSQIEAELLVREMLAIHRLHQHH